MQRAGQQKPAAHAFTTANKFFIMMIAIAVSDIPYRAHPVSEWADHVRPITTATTKTTTNKVRSDEK